MRPFDIMHDWKSRAGALATMHKKEQVISPVLKGELGLTLIVPENFNTDLFGTFTRDITRAGNQLEAARKKALSAIEFTGLDLAVASEGSFGVHPSIPFLPSSLEIVLLLDKKNDLEIVGHYRSTTVLVRGHIVRTPEEAVAIAESWGFPRQGVIVRLSEKSNRNIYKEITTVAELKTVSTELLGNWFTSSIYIETNMRAHRCPARMQSIEAATLDLAKNCHSRCPQCTTPGFVVNEVVKGLPCSDCGLPTELTLSLQYLCRKCHYVKMETPDGASTADSVHCGQCNP